jgi:hypothetical protein
VVFVENGRNFQIKACVWVRWRGRVKGSEVQLVIEDLAE